MQKWLPLIVFIVILGVARVIGASTPDTFPNLQPLGALFFCGMALFGVRWIWIPALAWFLTYPLTSAMNGYGWSAQLLVPLIGFTAVAVLGCFFQKKAGGWVFAGSLVSAVVFYLLTNTLSWVFDPSYGKSLAGLGQALTVGLPGFPPTWIFLRNGLIAQAIFSGAFLLAYRSLQVRLGEGKLARSQPS